MARSQFLEELSAMGYAWKNQADNRGYIEFTVPLGRFAGQIIRLGFQIGDEYPVGCPTGPHIFPRLLPQNPTGGLHPFFGIHDSPFGPEWQYWSRPFHPWQSTRRTAEEYLRHIRHLFDFQ